MRNMYDPKHRVSRLVDSIHNDIEESIDAAYLQGQEWMRDECVRRAQNVAFDYAGDDSAAEAAEAAVRAIECVEVDQP